MDVRSKPLPLFVVVLIAHLGASRGGIFGNLEECHPTPMG